MHRNERKMIHVSFDLVDKFVPRIPENRCVGEDATMPRICAGPHIRNCLSAIPQAGETIYWTDKLKLPVIIHAYYLRCKHHVDDVSRYVADAKSTGEIWLLESPSEVKRIDYQILFDGIEWYTDPYGYKQRYPTGVKLKKVCYQDNLKNFLDKYGKEPNAIEEFKRTLPNVSYRQLITNMGEKVYENTLRRV